MDPPTYVASSLQGSRIANEEDSSALPALLNLVPLPGETGFQHGYLGYTSSSLKGTLQVKFTSSDASSYRSSITKVTVEFAGIERVAGEDAGNGIELAREVRTLWEKHNAINAPGTSEGSNGPSGSGPPGSLDFDIRLTDDLPHCCHIGSGSIVYTLKARLHTASKDVLAVTTPVHLSRTSPPIDSPQANSRSVIPEIYTSAHPTEVAIFFPHGTSDFRRSESIELRVRMPPPDAALVQEKGLKLRSISGELHRQVSLRADDNEDPDAIHLLETPALDTLISHSGKAAAFSSSRSVFLNLWLQPVPADFCESITQSTIMLDIKFSIRVIASFQGKIGDRQEVVLLDKAITIIPDYPSATAADLGLTPSAAPRQTTSDGKARPQASTSSANRLHPDLLRAFQEEIEHDGYEEFSEDANLEDAPPHIDADQPPPALEPSEATSSSEAPFDPQPPPTPSLLHTKPLSPSEVTDEAPPYSTSAITSADVPRIAVASEAETSRRPPEHHDHHNDSATLPPPPYGESR